MGDGVATGYDLIYWQQGAGINYNWMDYIWDACQSPAGEFTGLIDVMRLNRVERDIEEYLG